MVEETKSSVTMVSDTHLNRKTQYGTKSEILSLTGGLVLSLKDTGS